MPRFGATDSTSQAAARECKRFLPAGGFFELVNRSQFQSSIPFRRGKGEYSRPAGHLSLGTAFYSLIIWDCRNPRYSCSRCTLLVTDGPSAFFTLDSNRTESRPGKKFLTSLGFYFNGFLRWNKHLLSLDITFISYKWVRTYRKYFPSPTPNLKTYLLKPI